MLKQPSAGDLVEASSNLFAAVKTTARKIFAASPLRKKSRDFFRLRSNSGVYSSSISDCTAHNAAHCDVGNGTPQKGFWLLLSSQKYHGGLGRHPAPIKIHFFAIKKRRSEAAAIRRIKVLKAQLLTKSCRVTQRRYAA